MSGICGIERAGWAISSVAGATQRLRHHPPWAEAHGYRHRTAPRSTNRADGPFKSERPNSNAGLLVPPLECGHSHPLRIGIYPDHAQLFAQSPRHQAARRRTLPDYERAGRHFYSVAAREPEPPWPGEIFEALADQFNLARQALNTLSDRYLRPLRERYFEPPS